MAWRRKLNHLECRGHSIGEADRHLGVDGKPTCRKPGHRFDVLGPGRPVLDLYEMIPSEALRHRDLKTLVNQPFHYCTRYRIVHRRVEFTPGTVAHGLGRGIACEKEFRSEERRVGKECRSRWSPYH